MSSFESRMKKIAERLSKSAQVVVKQVLVSEHKERFSDTRDALPEVFATKALGEAKDQVGE